MKIELINEILEDVGLEEIKLQGNEKILITLGGKKDNHAMG